MSRAIHWAMVREAFTVALAFVALLFVLRLCSGCKSPEQAGATAAESAYGAQLLRCVDQATTLEESRACRKRVNLEWGIVEKEAGAR